MHAPYRWLSSHIRRMETCLLQIGTEQGPDTLGHFVITETRRIKHENHEQLYAIFASFNF